MRNARYGTLATDFVTSECVAFPLASESAFRNCIVSLSPTLTQSTMLLWRDCEREARQWGSYSLDELVAVRDALWFPNNKHITLQEYLTEAIAVCISLGGDTERTNDGNTSVRRRMSWLCKSLPPDLIACADRRTGGS